MGTNAGWYRISRHSVSTNEDFDAYRDELMSMGAKIGLVTVSRESMNPKELTIAKGEYLEVRLL